MRGIGYLKKSVTGESRPEYRFRDTYLFLALMLWVCSLPLIAILAFPFLGWKISLLLAGLLLLAALVACRFLCAFRPPKNPENQKKY